MAIPGMNVAAALRSVLMVGAPLMIVATIGPAVEVKPKPVSVTGCLQKGTAENEFVLTTKRGKKYEVVGASLPLAAHVGHMVTIKGKVHSGKEEKGETKGMEQMEEKNGGEAAEAHEAGRIEATSLTMVKATCS
jgi:hypothetical protein